MMIVIFTEQGTNYKKLHCCEIPKPPKLSAYQS